MPPDAPGRTDGPTSSEQIEQHEHQHVPWWLLAAASLLTQALTLCSGIITARLLGVEGRGQVLMVTTVSTAAAQLTLGGGLPNAITRLLAERSLTARDGLHGLVRRWSGQAGLVGLLAAAYFLLVQRGDLDVELGVLALVVALTTVQVIAQRVLMGAMLGEGTAPIRIALTGVAPQAAVVVVLAAALALGLDLGAVGVTTVVLLASGGVLAFRVRSLRPARGRAPLDPARLRAVVRDSHVSSVGPVDGLALDRLLIGSLLGNTLLGLYSVAYALSQLHHVLGMSLAGVALPRLAVVQDDRAAERALVRRTLGLAVALLAVVTLVVEAVLEPFVRLTFGADFVDAVPVARLVVVAAAFLALRRVLIAILQARDRARFASATELVLAVALGAGIAVVAWLERSSLAPDEALLLVGGLLLAVAALSCLVLGAAVVVTGRAVCTDEDHASPDGGAHSA